MVQQKSARLDALDGFFLPKTHLLTIPISIFASDPHENSSKNAHVNMIKLINFDQLADHRIV
jgi:hypothetical protein